MYTTLGMLKASAAVAAFPTLVSVDFNEDSTSPHIANIPAVLVGDLLFIFTTFGTSGTLGASPAGWTQLAGTAHGIYKWITVASAATTVNMNASGSPADPGFTVVLVRGADTAQNPQGAVFVEGPTASPNPPSLDPTWADTSNRFILYCGTSNNACVVTGVPSGYTLTEANAGTATSSGIATKTSTSSAVEDPGNFTLSGGASLVRTFTIAVKGI